MEFQGLLPFPEKSNPFEHDIYHMGTKIGNNVMIMYDVHNDKKAEYIIIVDIETGKRAKIIF